MKYEYAEDNEWIQPVKKDFKLVCCDCGLTHDVDFRIVRKGRKEKIQFRVRRNNRITGQIRRHLKE